MKAMVDCVLFFATAFGQSLSSASLPALWPPLSSSLLLLAAHTACLTSVGSARIPRSNRPQWVSRCCLDLWCCGLWELLLPITFDAVLRACFAHLSASYFFVACLVRQLSIHLSRVGQKNSLRLTSVSVVLLP